MSDFNNGYARPVPQTADMSVDAGLRSFMLGVYNKLALGLVVAGVLSPDVSLVLCLASVGRLSKLYLVAEMPAFMSVR